MSTYTFIVSDENIVNSQGFRLMTDGIDISQYERNPVVLLMHQRGKFMEGATGSEVIGKAVKLTKSNGQLIAELEFDTEDELGKKIESKVKRGFLNMTSVGADITATSTDVADMLPGQKYETVTKSKLVEISIADIGSNDNALRLSRDGQPTQLKLINQENKPENMLNQKIALALGLDSTTADEILEARVKEISLAHTTAVARVEELENEIKLSKQAEANALIDRGVELGLINEGFKAAIALAFEKDHDAEKASLTKMIGDAEKEATTSGAHGKVKEIHLSSKGAKGTAGAPEESYDYLQKHKPLELKRIHKDEPEKYAQLAKAYGEGVRYIPKN